DRHDRLEVVRRRGADGDARDLAGRREGGRVERHQAQRQRPPPVAPLHPRGHAQPPPDPARRVEAACDVEVGVGRRHVAAVPLRLRETRRHEPQPARLEHPAAVALAQATLDRPRVGVRGVDPRGRDHRAAAYAAATVSRSAARTWSSCVFGDAFGITCTTVPSASMMNVERFTPMYVRPYIDFSPHTPYSSATAWSASASSVKLRSCLSWNFAI